MPYVTSVERLARQEGREEGRQEGARAELLAAIQTTLKNKYEASGTRLMTKIRPITDLACLRKVLMTVIEATSLQTVRECLDA